MFNTKEYKEERLTGNPTISRETYNAVIAIVVIWGLFINIIMCKYCPSFVSLFGGGLAGAISYFAFIILGAIMIYKSNNPVISFVGFTFISIAIGLILRDYVAYFDTETILRAFGYTAGICALIGSLAIIKPDLFSSLGPTLLISLFAVILIEVVLVIFFHQSFIAIDFIVILIFSLYFGYDLTKSQDYIPSLDNAIDSAADLYMDIINIFIRILAILGKSK